MYKGIRNVIYEVSHHLHNQKIHPDPHSDPFITPGEDHRLYSWDSHTWGVPVHLISGSVSGQSALDTRGTPRPGILAKQKDSGIRRTILLQVSPFPKYQVIPLCWIYHSLEGFPNTSSIEGMIWELGFVVSALLLILTYDTAVSAERVWMCSRLPHTVRPHT